MSLSYYRKKITEYEQLRRTAYKKIDTNDAALAKLNEIKPLLISLEGYLRSAENNFQNGGYLYNNETLSQGKLLEDADKVAEGLTTVTDSIDKLTRENADHRSNIRYYNRKIEWYKKQYNNAKKEETK